jgi:hypothetical protein
LPRHVVIMQNLPRAPCVSVVCCKTRVYLEGDWSVKGAFTFCHDLSAKRTILDCRFI